MRESEREGDRGRKEGRKGKEKERIGSKSSDMCAALYSQAVGT